MRIGENLKTCWECRAARGIIDPPMSKRLCPEDGETCLAHAQGVVPCKLGLLSPPPAKVPGKPRPSPAEGVQRATPKKSNLPALWRLLHTETNADAKWIKAFSRAVPCGECRREWRLILSAIPPVYGDGWFEWSVAAHNAVNAKLGKPMMGVDEARAKWLAKDCPMPV